jgi:hypothetical protein
MRLAEVGSGKKDQLLDQHLDHIPDLEGDLGGPCAISHLALECCMRCMMVHNVKSGVN